MLDRWWKMPLLVFCASLLTLCAAMAVWGSNRPLDAGSGDASQYLAIGRSLADGQGFKDTVSLWPDQPAYDRMPGWPFVIAVGLRIAPWASGEAVVHYTGAACLALAAAFFALLHRQLGVHPGLSVLGGLGVALSPAAVAIVAFGLSESLFLLLAAVSVAALLAGGRWLFASALCFGLTPLVRTNFVLIPALIVLFLLIVPGARPEVLKGGLARLGILLLIAYLPVTLWAARNYTLTGRIGFLSSLEGETLYGSNNEVVATDLSKWGYWIVPDGIPGETGKAVLAQGRTDVGLNDYYHARAMAWIKTHLADYPRLVLGKLIRAFVPVPWIPNASSWAAFSYRFVLDVLFLILAPWWWSAANRLYLLVISAMFSLVLLTTVVYYGSYRFTHCAELFFIPCILLGYQRWRSGAESRANS